MRHIKLIVDILGINKTNKIKEIIMLSLALACYRPDNSFPSEQIPADESKAIQQITESIEQKVKAEAKNKKAIRDAHPKSHGCVRAKFSVNHSLPKELRIGIFKEFREYPAWIRFSNGSGKIQDDSVGDARGMAIKLMQVESSVSGTQDFLMINHPVFFVRNAVDYVEFQKKFSEGSPFKFFFPGFNPFNFRLHEFGIVNDIKNKKVISPLNTRYWSTTPYRFGMTAMKFLVQNCNAPMTGLKTNSANFLRENLIKQLSHDQACFDFMVQLRTLPLEMPIDDPTSEWKESDSPFIPVARITIPPQAFSTPDQDELCENLSFTPWHASKEYEPLGGINRVRKTVYETISRTRHKLNGFKSVEPKGFW